MRLLQPFLHAKLTTQPGIGHTLRVTRSRLQTRAAVIRLPQLFTPRAQDNKKGQRKKCAHAKVNVAGSRCG